MGGCPIKMNREWFTAFGKDFAIYRPVCMYCEKSLRVGSMADGFYPYMDQFSYHLSCKRKSNPRPGAGEGVSVMKVNIVDFHDADQDPQMNQDTLMTALFVDDKLVLIGDWYHHGIDRQIEGYLKALKLKEPRHIQVPTECTGEWELPDGFDLAKVRADPTPSNE